MTVEEVLAHVRGAVHYDRIKDHPKGFRVTGTATWMGMTIPTDIVFRPDGEFVSRGAGSVSWAQGFDGKSVWAVNVIGSLEQVLLEHRDQVLAENWLLSHRWLAPGSSMKVALAPTQPDKGKVSLTVSFGGTWEGAVVVDTSTWLPAALTSVDSGTVCQTKIAGYLDYKGILFPRDYSVVRDKETDVSKSQKIEDASTAGDETFKMPAWRPDDTTFDKSVPAKVEVKLVQGGVLLVRPLVNGQDIGWFILASDAGGNAIDRKAADKLKLPTFGGLAQRGSEAVGVGMRRVQKIQLGPATIKNLFINDMDFSAFSAQLGVPFAGIIGYDFFRRTVVEVNTSKGAVSIYDPSTYKLGAGSWQPLMMHEGVPLALATFEGKQGYFRIQPPGSSLVVFGLPAVQRLNLLDGRAVQNIPGGDTEVRGGYLDYLQVFGHRYEKAPAMFLMGKPPGEDTFADRSITGVLGASFLEQLTLIFDFAHERVGVIEQQLPPVSLTGQSAGRP